MGGGRSRYGVTYGSKRYKELKAQNRTQDTDSSSTRFEEFGSYHEAMTKSTAWFADANNSNSQEWLTNLKQDEKTAIKDYTGESGISYHEINKALYTQDWKDIDPSVQKRIESMDKAMDKAVLLKGMNVTRQADFKIFGAKSGEKMTMEEIKDFVEKNGKDGVLTNKGYLSSRANNHGAAIDGSGLVIHVKVPPSVGAGAYVNPISKHASSSENEYLFNRSSMYKFDLNSMYKASDGKIHINARWVGLDKKKKRKK